MRASWSIIWLTGSSDIVSVFGLPWPVALRPHARARAVRLRLNERTGQLVLSFPRRMSRKAALDWAGRQSEWATGQIERMAPATPFHPGQQIPVRGVAIELFWEAGGPRAPVLRDGRLAAGGPVESFPGRIERHLKTMARQELSERTAMVAAAAGVTVRSVSVGDAVSRWGSCSASGAIRYNWRLILAPPHLLHWVVAHEVAHRRHMNHGTDFRRLEANLFGGDVAAARAELRRLGPGLKRVGLTI